MQSRIAWRALRPGRSPGRSSSRDSSASHDLERLQKVVIGEIKHRVKNILSAVQAIARQTMERERTEAHVTFEKRILALGRAQGLITRDASEGVDLQGLSPRAWPCSCSRSSEMRQHPQPDCASPYPVLLEIRERAFRCVDRQLGEVRSPSAVTGRQPRGRIQPSVITTLMRRWICGGQRLRPEAGRNEPHAAACRQMHSHRVI